MEEFLILLLQFLVEFLLEAFCQVPFDWVLSRNRTTAEPEKVLCSSSFWWLIGGCSLGGLSLLVFDHSLISSSSLRIASLLLAPIFSAYISKTIAVRREVKNPLIVPRNHFWQAFWFTFGLVLIRFAFAGRA